MACYSTVQQTKMTDADRLEEALKSLGHKTLRTGDHRIEVVGGPTFQRYQGAGKDVGFKVDSSVTVDGVGRRYAELSARAWAKRKGFSVAEVDGNRMVLKNRKGG